jgi:hypothetical protein
MTVFFFLDEPAVSCLRGTSCWVPFWGLHMRRMQGELDPCKFMEEREESVTPLMFNHCVLTWLCLRCQVLIMWRFENEVFWGVTPCGLVDGC